MLHSLLGLFSYMFKVLDFDPFALLFGPVFVYSWIYFFSTVLTPALL